MSQLQPDPTVQWRRVHPLTPLMRGWFFLVALAFFTGRNLLEDFDEVKGVLTDAGWWLLLGIVVVLGFVCWSPGLVGGPRNTTWTKAPSICAVE